MKSKVVQDQLRSDLPKFRVGYTLSVHYKIKEGNKERIQIFTGIVIDRHGGESLDATFTILRNSAGSIKVIRTFPLHSPMIAKIEVVTGSIRARKANLNYLQKVKDPIKTVRTKKAKIEV
jgi:large subunit ribosomal protein L19